MTVGKEIKRIRLSKGLTQAQLGEKTGIDAASIRKYENGQYHAKQNTLEIIAKALDVNLDTLTTANIDFSTAMHSLFHLFSLYGGDFVNVLREEEDADGNMTTVERTYVSFLVLEPLIKLWKDIFDRINLKDISPEEKIKLQNDFTDCFPQSISPDLITAANVIDMANEQIIKKGLEIQESKILQG